MRDAFASCHPIIEAVFYGTAIVLGVCIRHPLYLLCAFLAAGLYLIRLRGREAFRFLGGIALLLLLITVLNPLVNPLGETVLFTWIKGRSFTLESLLYGAVNALMIGSVLLWFACLSETMTTDKWLFLFGKGAPAATMVLTMVLGLVPGYLRKADEIGRARESIGMSCRHDPYGKRLTDGKNRLTALTGWAMESAVTTGDSMEARGYGSGERSRFSLFAFPVRQKILLVIQLLWLGGILYFLLQGGAHATYFPGIHLAGLNKTGIVMYGSYLLLPMLLNWREDVLWHRWK